MCASFVQIQMIFLARNSEKSFEFGKTVREIFGISLTMETSLYSNITAGYAGYYLHNLARNEVIDCKACEIIKTGNVRSIYIFFIIIIFS